MNRRSRKRSRLNGTIGDGENINPGMGSFFEADEYLARPRLVDDILCCSYMSKGINTTLYSRDSDGLGVMALASLRSLLPQLFL